MKTFSLDNIPDDVYQKAIDAICQRGGCPSDDPTARADFAQGYVLTRLGDIITEHVMQSHREQRQAEFESLRNTVKENYKSARDLIKIKVK